MNQRRNGVKDVLGAGWLYASSKDRALRVPQALHDYPRAGGSCEGLTVFKGIETIAASIIDTSLLGHSYFADAIQLVRDVLSVILEGLPPADCSLFSSYRRSA